MMRRLQDWATGWRPSPKAVREFIGRWLTEPAADVWFETPSRALTGTHFIRRAQRQGVRLDRASRMVWQGREAYINGEPVPAATKHRTLIRQLADQRALNGNHLAQLEPSADLWPLLAQWHAQGWIHLLP